MSPNDNKCITAEQQVAAILRAVADDFICLIDVDLETEVESTYFLQNDTAELPDWSQSTQYSIRIRSYADMFIVPEDKDRFLAATRIGLLKSILTQQREFVIEYDTLIDGRRHNFQGRFTKGGDSVYPHMYIGIRDITLTKQNELISREIAEYERYNNLLSDTVANKPTILVVDDNALNREILSSALADRFTLLQAENGQEGLDVLHAHHSKIMLILSDIAMPVMSGTEMIAEIQKDPLLKQIPIIVATSMQDSSIEQECLKLGAADFVPKPYNIPVMLHRIQNLLNLRKSVATIAEIEHDTLTGLYTREAFFRHADLLIKMNPDKDYTIIVSDIMNFRKINENHGTDAGNNVLCEAAKQLLNIRGAHYIAGRLGADQFVAILPYQERLIHSNFLPDMTRQMSANISVKNIDIKYGIYQHVDRSLTVPIMCDRAVMALRTIKHQYGKHFVCYSNDIAEHFDRNHRIESSMQKAYDEDQFRIFYQPKHSAATGAVIGAEALIRWVHPEFGFMSPGNFIPVFERTGFIAMADKYVWDHVCLDMKEWISCGIPVVPVSINTSRAELDNIETVNSAVAFANAAGIDPKYLHIEVTETLFAKGNDQLVATIQEFRKRGYKVELDDFGSGYSSLTTLSDLPVDIVKFDMSFMDEIGDPRKTRVFSTCIKLAKDLKLSTVVEGVETEEQRLFVQRSGADAIQGYFYSKPIPKDEFKQYLLSHAVRQDTEHQPIMHEPVSVDSELPVSPGLFIFKADATNTLVYASPEACSIWGYPNQDELMSHTDFLSSSVNNQEEYDHIFTSVSMQLKTAPLMPAFVEFNILDSFGNGKRVCATVHYIAHKIQGPILYVFVTTRSE